MYVQAALLDLYVKMHQEEIERLIAHNRLVAEATRNDRSLRAHVADRLYDLASLVEGQERTPLRDELSAAA
jgi:hypothetical protein